MSDQPNSSILLRILFSLFIALVACGMSFYLILFVSLAVMALTHPANPATMPALKADLRNIVLPLCVLVGALVFVASYRRSGRWDRPDTEKSKSSNKAVV